MVISGAALRCLPGLLSSIHAGGNKQAVKYLSRTEVVKMTLKGKGDKRNRHIEIVLSLGSPNFEERAFIKSCERAGEKFPVKKVQVKGVSRT